VDTLKKAYADPAAYPDLIVRIGGHSRYFNDFDDTMKRRFIERFEVEEGAFA
jgi:pyruvate-formate lyase